MGNLLNFNSNIFLFWATFWEFRSTIGTGLVIATYKIERSIPRLCNLCLTQPM